MIEKRTYGRQVLVELDIYDKCKYISSNKNRIKVNYSIESLDIISGGAEADEIEAMTDSDGIDDYHEYLVLHLTDGNTSTFRNSYVDMFRIN